MIYDKIDNLETYAGISEDIRMGLEWLRDVNSDIEKGVYELSPRVKAIVSEYPTREINEYGYEAHREYIDIQYLVSGEEKICCLPLEYLKEIMPYNKDCDAAFYVGTDIRHQELLLGNGYFAILFPQDGHMPQLCVNNPEIVKKVVIKVKIGE
jgi:YhcH/YjgK/YiaL family protein